MKGCTGVKSVEISVQASGGAALVGEPSSHLANTTRNPSDIRDSVRLLHGVPMLVRLVDLVFSGPPLEVAVQVFSSSFTSFASLNA